MDLSNKTSMEIRLIMKDLGWSSHDKLTDMGWGGTYGYGIWFEKWVWHGRSTLKLTGDKVCFHRHTPNLSDIDSVARVCAQQALSAYAEYTDCIPCQDAKNATCKATMCQDWDDERCLSKKND